MTFGLGHLGASFGKLGAGNGRGHSTGFSLTAPVLSIESDVNTAVLVLKLLIDATVPLGYKIQVAVSANADMSSPLQTDTTTILSGDLPSEGGDGQVDDAPFTALSSGTYYVQAVILDASNVQASGYSNVPTITLVIAAGAAFFPPRYFGNRYFPERYFG